MLLYQSFVGNRLNLPNVFYNKNSILYYNQLYELVMYVPYSYVLIFKACN